MPTPYQVCAETLGRPSQTQLEEDHQKDLGCTVWTARSALGQECVQYVRELPTDQPKAGSQMVQSSGMPARPGRRGWPQLGGGPLVWTSCESTGPRARWIFWMALTEASRLAARSGRPSRRRFGVCDAWTTPWPRTHSWMQASRCWWAATAAANSFFARPRGSSDFGAMLAPLQLLHPEP